MAEPAETYRREEALAQMLDRLPGYLGSIDDLLALAQEIAPAGAGGAGSLFAWALAEHRHRERPFRAAVREVYGRAVPSREDLRWFRAGRSWPPRPARPSEPPLGGEALVEVLDRLPGYLNSATTLTTLARAIQPIHHDGPAHRLARRLGEHRHHELPFQSAVDILYRRTGPWHPDLICSW